MTKCHDQATVRKKDEALQVAVQIVFTISQTQSKHEYNIDKV